MAFDKPIVEQIAEALVAIIEGVTTGNGYQVSIAGVDRPGLRYDDNPYVPSHLRCMFEQRDEDASERKRTQQRYTRSQVFLATVWISPEKADDYAFDTWCNVVRADMHKAIMADEGLGAAGLSDNIHSREVLPAYLVTDATIDGIQIPVEVVYSFVAHNPYA